MADFSGRLTVINSQSSLDNDLLLRAGIPDATQAIFAATQFLLKTKKLLPGQMIKVTGDKGTFGSVSVIVMSDARADASQPFAASTSNLAFAASPSSQKTTKSRRAGSKKTVAAKGSKKSGGKKAASVSRKGGSKAGASKKSAAARKSSAAKSSAKK